MKPKPWQRTFEKVHLDLEMEAEDNKGIISQKVLESIISLNIGKDTKRTIPDSIAQLVAAHVLEPINQFSYRYMMDGYGEKAKAIREIEAKKEIEKVLGARIT
jgi:hypothetical protein